MEYQDIWEEVLTQIKPLVPQLSFNTFFMNSHIVKIKEGAEAFTTTIVVPHRLARDKFEQHKKDIEEALTEVLAAPCVAEIRIKERAEEVGQTNPSETEKEDSLLDDTPRLIHKDDQKEDDPSTLFSRSTQKNIQMGQEEYALKMALKKSGLNPEFTFQNFAVSPTNEMAFAGATAVAKNPGYTYNPFFIYGDVGVGKTHLMHAAGLKILGNNTQANLVYCIGEQFTNEIIEAIQTKKTPQFRNKYRKVNVLLIDDIQFIAGKDFVQEEFFHTFNAIKSAGGQVIMTADKPPSEIRYLEDRLRSRFEEGLAIDIQEPNFELRTAILRIKSEQMGMNLPMECAQMIAQQTTSTRKLEGFLKTIYARVSLTDTPITTSLISELLKKQAGEDFIDDKDKRPFVRPGEIIKVISKHYNISEQQLYGSRRSKPIVTPRQYAMYLLRIDLDLPLQEIGRIFGGRDHTTVMHAVNKVAKEVSQSDIMQQEFSTLRKQIYG